MSKHLSQHHPTPLQGETVPDIFSTRYTPRRISWAVCAAEQDDALEAGAAAAAALDVGHAFNVDDVVDPLLLFRSPLDPTLHLGRIPGLTVLQTKGETPQDSLYLERSLPRRVSFGDPRNFDTDEVATLYRLQLVHGLAMKMSTGVRSSVTPWRILCFGLEVLGAQSGRMGLWKNFSTGDFPSSELGGLSVTLEGLLESNFP
ncbi:MAG: hypothetical protein GY696_38655 [Gammaproteobacteria bacterium]|nr:hypothetical protein [Gammaproteobacteria bacterium]